MLSELPAEMFQILVSALLADFDNTVIRINKQILGLTDPASNHVIHAGQSELLLVEQVQMSRTHMQLIGHFSHVPIQLRVVYDLPAERQKLMIVRYGCMMLYIALKL